MSINKMLNEMSKPVAWLVKGAQGQYVALDNDNGGVGIPLYPQGYVSILLAALEDSRRGVTYFCNLNAQKNERIAEMEQARFIAWPGAMFAPVLARIKVDVKRRDGSLSVAQSAGNIIWYHQDRPDDVVAFALTAEGEE